MLEGLEWSSKCFLTLTYSPDKMPLVQKSTTPTLLRTDLQKWLKRFRKKVEPTKVRYFAAGEYGDQTQRPHYHLIMFGWPACAHGRTRKHVKVCCEACEVVRQTWGQGHIMNAEFNRHTVQYTCGYVIKKMTNPDDFRLGGREPEFATMSLRPGIGAYAMDEMASQVMKYDLESLGDVPTALDHGRKTMPLGRYLTKRLRERTGRDAAVPQAKVQKMAEAMQPLRQFAFDNSLPLSKVVQEALKPQTDQAERRHRFYRKKGVL